jgi:branched-chain amino acid transport system substrate-binding protein
MLIGRIVDWVVGPKVYKVYVVGNFQTDVVRNTASDPMGPASTAADDIWAKLDALRSPGKIDGIPIEFAKVSDSGDPADAERISIDLAGRSDCVLVVGHFSSTQTKAALPAYLRGVTSPIPVILTTETNPDLVPPRTAATDFDPILRLAPTDEDQARTAVAFAAKRKANGFWAIQATSNSVYSSYLTSQFVDRALGESDAVLIWTDNTLVPFIKVTESLKMKWIFFAGGWRDALIAIRQLRAIPGGQNLNIILSDAAANEKLLQYGNKTVEGIFLTHHLRAETYNSETRYGVYGDDVFQLTKQLLQMTDGRFSALARRNGGLGYWLRHLLGLRRATDARRAIAGVMREAIERKHPFSLSGRTCIFQTKTATCEGAGFFVWRVEQGSFRTVHSESCVSSGSAPKSDGRCGWRQTLKAPVARSCDASAAALKLPTCSQARHSSGAGSAASTRAGDPVQYSFRSIRALALTRIRAPLMSRTLAASPGIIHGLGPTGAKNGLFTLSQSP